ncbi:unnamed protein product, partial [Lymnaea stagnalis]
MSSNEEMVSGGGGPSVQMIILMFMLSVFSVVGSIGNGMVIFVFQRIRDKTTAQVFIITMAVIDLFTCMVIIPFTMVVEYIEFNLKYDFFCKLYHFLITSKVPMSAFIMVAIAFDRYFCICHPLKRIVTLRRVKLTLFLLTLLACTLGVITSLFYSVYQIIERIDSARIDQVLGTNFTQSIAKLDKFIRVRKVNDNDAEEEKIVGRGGEFYHGEKEKMMRALHKHNVTFEDVGNNSYPITSEVFYLGICDPSAVTIGPRFLAAYRPIHTAVWPTCLVTVVVLYLMIYRFMCLRRSKKLQQKLIMCSYVNGDGTYENTRLVSGEGNGGRRHSHLPEQKYHWHKNRDSMKRYKGKSKRRKSQHSYEADRLRDENRSANVRTALMLFTVTIVFVVAFVPSGLMLVGIISRNKILFYIYFIYNVANPFIYAFMNHIFKDYMRKMF